MADFTGKVGLIVGVANHRSLAWAIAQATAKAGATLVLTYQGRFEEHVGDLADTLTPKPMVLPLDVTSDEQIASVYQKIQEAHIGKLRDLEMHEVAGLGQLERGRAPDGIVEPAVDHLDVRPQNVPESPSMYHRPSTRAGDASVRSPIRFTCSRSNAGPAFNTNVSPSSFVKNTLPSAATGEAEKPSRAACPRRPCHITFPVVASSDVAMLVMSLTR